MGGAHRGPLAPRVLRDGQRRCRDQQHAGRRQVALLAAGFRSAAARLPVTCAAAAEACACRHTAVSVATARHAAVEQAPRRDRRLALRLCRRRHRRRKAARSLDPSARQGRLQPENPLQGAYWRALLPRGERSRQGPGSDRRPRRLGSEGVRRAGRRPLELPRKARREASRRWCSTIRTATAASTARCAARSRTRPPSSPPRPSRRSTGRAAAGRWESATRQERTGRPPTTAAIWPRSTARTRACVSRASTISRP